MSKIIMGILMLLMIQTSVQAETPTHESVTKLYVATFNRAPLKVGLDYWVYESGLILEDVAMSFFDQEETKAKYPADSTVEDFIIAVYANLFNREPAPAGLVYWAEQINSGKIHKSVFILAVMNGAKDTETSKDKTILINKTTVGLAFANAEINSVYDSICVMVGITDNLTTVNASTEIISQLLVDVPCIIEHTLQDYIDAGVTWVAAPYLDELNIKAVQLNLNDSEDRKKIQVIVYTINRPPVGMPKRTGHTLSYDDNGHIVIDESIKDDGFYQKGLAPAYTREALKEVVTDHVTGLMWQDNTEAATVTKPWVWGDYNDYYDTYGDTADTYCTDLTLGGFSDWRLPTFLELKDIINWNSTYHIDTTVFVNFSDDYYWTSTTDTNSYNGWDAFVVNFNSSSYSSTFDNERKGYSHYVRCVR